MNPHWRAALSFWFLLVLLGCSSGPNVVPVKGIATRDGKPVKELYIKFYPEEGRSSWGYTDDQGRFELDYAREQKGALVGTHKVTAENKPRGANFDGKFTAHPDKDAIHEKYGKLESTKMSVEVQANKDLELKFD